MHELYTYVCMYALYTYIHTYTYILVVVMCITNIFYITYSSYSRYHDIHKITKHTISMPYLTCMIQLVKKSENEDDLHRLAKKSILTNVADTYVKNCLEV